MSGVDRRLGDLIPEGGPALWVAVDDALISGPTHWLKSPDELFTEDLLAQVDGVVCFSGAAMHCDSLSVPVIINLTASTALYDHTRKVQVATVAQAKELGAEAVAVHINMSSPSESEQLQTLGRVAGECQRLDMPLVAIAHPRAVDPLTGADDNYDEMRMTDHAGYTRLVAHTVRVAVELGADAVKTVFTGSSESFREVVDSALGVPVLAAGGPLRGDAAAMLRARQAIQAGAAGVCWGRQIFQHPEPLRMVRLLSQTLDDAHAKRNFGGLLEKAAAQTGTSSGRYARGDGGK